VFALPSQFYTETLTEIVFLSTGEPPGGKAFLAAATVEFYVGPTNGGSAAVYCPTDFRRI